MRRNLVAGNVRIPLLIACLAPPGSALAQEQFSARVVEDHTGRPVKSRIEYEFAPNVWRPIRTTGNDGSLAGICPGKVSIRANAWPEFRLSQMELCGGTHMLTVARRPVSAVAAYLPAGSQISLDQWVQASASAAVSEARRNPEAAGSEDLVVFSKYVITPSQIGPRRRELIETRLLNAWAVDFQNVDTNRDQRISKGELRSALRDPS